jgi:hypothetical protein
MNPAQGCFEAINQAALSFNNEKWQIDDLSAPWIVKITAILFMLWGG